MQQMSNVLISHIVGVGPFLGPGRAPFIRKGLRVRAPTENFPGAQPFLVRLLSLGLSFSTSHVCLSDFSSLLSGDNF